MNEIGRRDFFLQIPVVAGVVACTACAGASGARTSTSVSTSVSKSGALTADGALLVKLSEVQNKKSTLLDWPGSDLPVHLYNESNSSGESSWLAVSTECTHAGCEVEPSADRLACPCHGSEFKFSGEVLKGPAKHPLQRFSVTVQGDSLLIRKMGTS